MKSNLYPAQLLKRRALAGAIKLRVKPKVIRVQEMTRKWGSCSSAGTGTFASDLARESDHFQDYVMVHELLHPVQHGDVEVRGRRAHPLQVGQRGAAPEDGEHRQQATRAVAQQFVRRVCKDPRRSSR